jgi:predicted thioesterase
MMEIGKKLIIEKLVTETDTAAYYGSGLLNVFATPAMIALMEQSAYFLAKVSLPENQDTVGIEVNIKHTRATPLGVNVYAEAELIAIDGKKLTFNVVAFDEQGEIGRGVHMRYIINPAKYMNKLS